ncbi:Uncharacterised protein [uncultured archaeon]|nr:Uncharacterised protein [uncultured archaeon]
MAVVKKTKVDAASEALWESPSEANWKAMQKALKGSGIEYYKIVFANEGKLSKMQDLTKSFAELYDGRYKLVTKIPIFMRAGKKMRGATIYLVGLQVYNR